MKTKTEHNVHHETYETAHLLNDKTSEQSNERKKPTYTIVKTESKMEIPKQLLIPSNNKV